MKIEELIEKKIEEKKEFNIFELESELAIKMERKEKDKLINKLIDDDRLIKFFICSCPECGLKNNDGLFTSGIISDKKQCFSCKKKYTVSFDHIIMIFDSKKLTERFKNQ